MLRIDRIIGNRADPDLHDRLHEFEHHGLAIDVVKINTADLDRRRLRARSENGEDVVITLSRDDKLFDGAVLHLDATKAIIVRAREQRWLRLSSRSSRDALELGYHAGNLHWRVRFDGDDILVALDGPVESYVSRVAPMIADDRISFSEEGE